MTRRRGQRKLSIDATRDLAAGSRRRLRARFDARAHPRRELQRRSSPGRRFAFTPTRAAGTFTGASACGRIDPIVSLRPNAGTYLATRAGCGEVIPLPVILAVTATLAAAARAEPPVGRVSGSGAVESNVGFSSYISASITEGGQARGRARFDDVPVAGGRPLDVTCLRVGTDVSSDGNTRRFAVITGPVVEAETASGLDDRS